MCFSATASFALGSALTATGAVLTYKHRKDQYLFLSLIPLFFGIQQFSEGILWLNTPNQVNGSIAILSKNIFLFFAFIFWPIWIPLSLLRADHNLLRKMAITFSVGIGFALATLLGITIPYIAPTPYCFSIQYAFEKEVFSIENTILISFLNYTSLILYGLATLLPMFISSLKRMKLMGILGAFSAIVILWIDQAFFVSLWCFFAAVFSICLIYVLRTNSPNP